jgi:hypothetical protein
VDGETNPTARVAELSGKEHKARSIIRSLRITRRIYSCNTFINYKKRKKCSALWAAWEDTGSW